ncbi:MAG: response regulator [Planctomycetes bacterium]|nr:response regulator [Planctomycetota bacterium]
MTPKAPDSSERELKRLLQHVTLLEGMVETKTRELYAMNQDLEQIVEERTRELAAALERAEAASQAKQAFIAHMSHELRTPLHAICGMTEIIAARSSEAATLERVGTIRSAGTHMLSLVNQLLDLSWLTRDEMPLDLQRTDVTEMADDVAKTLAVQAGRKGLTVSTSIGELPPALMIDATRLREVLLNFAGNAIKFTTEGGVNIAVTGEPEDDRCALHWSVADTGCGMNAETLARVFDPFFQAADTFRRGHGGAGLGMPISRRIVQAMGGEVEVTSQLGSGTTVSFVTRHAIATTVAVEDEREPQARAGGDIAGLEVLVIDDQEPNCTVAAAILDLLGCAATTTVSPQDGLDRAMRGGFDVIVVDYHMPGLDGCQLVKRLRDSGCATPAMLATADLTEAARDTASAAGVDHILAKPFSADELRAACVALGLARGSDDGAATGGQPGGVPVATVAAAEPVAELPLFDVDEGLQRVGGKAAILRMVAQSFVASAPELLRQLEAGGEGTRENGHALKGSAASTSANRLASLGRQVEGGDFAPLESGLLFEVARQTLAAIETWLAAGE